MLRTPLNTIRNEREAASRVSGFLGELLGSVQAVKVAGTEVSATRHFETLSEVRRRAVLNDLLFSQVLNSANTTTINLTSRQCAWYPGRPRTGLPAGRVPCGALSQQN